MTSLHARANLQDPAPPADRALARARVAERGLTAAAAERVVRVALGELPVSIVGRATGHLRRFFSVGTWAAEDDAALAAAIGPGRDWYEEELDGELVLGFGWRANRFKVEVRYTPATETAQAGSETTAYAEADARTLGDTFEDAIVLDAGRTPNELRFSTGPGSGGTVGFAREDAARDPRVDALFRACGDLEHVSIGAGTVTATIADATRWNDVLLPLLDAITAGFVQPRATPPDRQLERAQREVGTLTHSDPRDLVRILDATTSPDPSFRKIAFERLLGADAVVGRAPWRRGLEDSSRAVRRATARSLAGSVRPETRDLLDQALNDTDACVRYYGVSGLARIGLHTSLAAVDARRRDPDVRVRLAAEAAVSGQLPT